MTNAANNDAVGEKVARFLEELAQLEPFSGVTYHGLTSLDDLGGMRRTWGILATSHDPRVATESFTAPVVMALLGRTGRDITAYSRRPAEQEVVIPPGATLRLLAEDVTDEGQPLVVFEQIGSVDAPTLPAAERAELIRSVKARISAAALEPGWTPLSPGKFTAPIPFEDDRKG